MLHHKKTVAFAHRQLSGKYGGGDKKGSSSSDEEEETPTTPAPVDDTASSGEGDGDMPDKGEDGTYEHVGCFMDSKDDRILGGQLKSPMMTPKVRTIHSDLM